MITKLEPNTPKTKEYLQYLFDEIIKHPPLKPGKLIELKVIEGSTPFPEITEIPIEPDMEGANSNDIIKEIKGGWYYSGDPWEQIENQAKNKDARQDARLEELHFYTDRVLRGISGPISYEILSDEPLNIILRFVIMNPEGIRGEAQELGIKVPAIELITGKKDDSRAIFNEMPPEIIWRGATIPIEEGSNSFYICKIAANREVGKPISWDEIAAEIEGWHKKEADIKRRTIYDAVRSLNEKIERITGKKLFKWENLNFHKIA